MTPNESFIAANTATNVLITLFIIVVWVISAYLEYRRKEALRQEQLKRQQSSQQREPQSGEIIEPYDDEETDLYPSYEEDEQRLREAEEAVKNAGYYPSPRGQDLETREEHLSPVPTPPNQPQPKEATERTAPTAQEIQRDSVWSGEIEGEQIAKNQIKGFDEAAFHKHEGQAYDLSHQEVSALKDFFPAGLSKAIISAEILSKPLVLRRTLPGKRHI